MILADFGSGFRGPFGAAPKSAQQTMSDLEKKLKAKGFDVSRTGPGATPAAKPPVAPPRTLPKPKPLPKKPVPVRPAPKPVARAVAPAPKPVVKVVKDASVAQLQRALAALGKVVGDSTLTKVVADGLIGPKTANALNLALKKYAIPGVQAPAPMRAGTLTPGQVLADAAALASFIELEISRAAAKRGKAPAAVKPAAAKPAAAKPAAAKPAAAKPAASASVLRLQQALKALGGLVGDSTLTALVPDGLIGPKTTAAANRALSKYAAGAPAASRTGKLPQLAVAQNAGGLADLIDAEISRRGQGGTAKRLPPVVRPGGSQGISRLQTALVSLGTAVKDKILKAVVVDGLTGPKTAAAVFRAMNTYIKSAPANFKAKLTPAGVASSATNIAMLVENEVARRVRGQTPPPTPDVDDGGGGGDDGDLPVIDIPVPIDTTPPPGPPVQPPVQPPPGPPVQPPPDRDDGDDVLPYVPPVSEKKSFPTAWVVGGAAGVLGLGTVIYLLARRKRSR